MIWTLRTLNRVRELRVKTHISSEQLALTSIDLWTETRRSLANRLQVIVSDLGLEINGNDLVHKGWTDHTNDWEVMICCWAPSTHEVQLVGGPFDGELITIEDLSAKAYALGGWNQDRRCWVYKYEEEWKR